MIYSCIIISDDIQEIRVLKNHIEIHAELNLAGCFNNIYSVPANTYSHIAFININQSVMAGYDQINLMRSNFEFIIFTGGKDEYARIAYDLAGSDYLSKPIVSLRFYEAIDKLSSYKNAEAKPEITIDSSFAIKDANDEYNWVIISYREVVAVESDKNYLKIFTASKCHFAHLALIKFEFIVLHIPNFMRVHRSFIVSRNHIRKIARNTIHMKNSDIKIPIGGNYRKNLQSFIDSISVNK